MLCPLADEWVSKTWSSHTMALVNVKKKGNSEIGHDMDEP